MANMGLFPMLKMMIYKFQKRRQKKKRIEPKFGFLVTEIQLQISETNYQLNICFLFI